MKRREAILQVALAMGSALSAPTMASVLQGYQPHRSEKRIAAPFALQPNEQALLDEITEVIMPATSTPGAKDAKVAETIRLILNDCYKPAQQAHFRKGLNAVEAESQKAYSKGFVNLPIEQKTAILKQFEQLAKAEAKQHPKRQEKLAKDPETTLGAFAPAGSDQTEAKLVDAETGVVVKDADKNAALVPFFTLVKELTILGYFSSEIGCTQALAYVPIPGRYEGVVKLKDGQKAWAT
ncbi:gluconate 2-dehydrogenase subunit 3 family protein [Spirosoma taeanense]|uniref:Gluconate 2-dehydrogenase subunit 3 family protein n=1 Tax=Spirosoma taeanense TaxID=2735870 RepID=A0A6M5Y6Q7_9BACT|nr:gluconate 2-dehydrogenase subunit 3 family protein [Spirosoma taeanense]QJW89565.1 gluconate 2-dehydrogenase subunit 3 family protein [Spirosoma taeanense]